MKKVKRKDFHLNKFRSDIKLFDDRDYICFDDKTWNQFVDFFLIMIENDKTICADLRTKAGDVNAKLCSLKDFEESVRQFCWKRKVAPNEGNLLVVLSCISDHWNIFPKEK